MRKAKAENPLEKPLKSLLKHAEAILSIPGFDSETLKRGINDARMAMAVKTKPNK